MKIGNEVSGMHLMKHLDLAPDYIYGSESRNLINSDPLKLYIVRI
jgi:hypothetical protein